jgi:hypothetical protein
MNKVFYSRISYEDAFSKAQQAGYSRVVGKTYNGKQFVIFAQPQPRPSLAGKI